MYEQSHRDYLRLWLSSSACHGLLTVIALRHYLQSPARQMPELEAGERGNY